jgi:N-acetylated-alpha-linked acidic dipeptidase
VLFPTPKTRVLEMLAPIKFTPTLFEPPLKADATSNQTNEHLPIYNAYSIDGEVTGELVYVNYDVPKDYEKLERRGVDVKGKIVIARCRGSWRGIRPKVAAEHNAINILAVRGHNKFHQRTVIDNRTPTLIQKIASV